jgi:hypothetical protein
MDPIAILGRLAGDLDDQSLPDLQGVNQPKMPEALRYMPLVKPNSELDKSELDKTLRILLE